MKDENIIELRTKGITIIRDFFTPSFLQLMHSAVETSFKKHQQIQQKQGNEIDTYGVALNVLCDHDNYLKLLGTLIDKSLIRNLEEHYFGSKFIMNSMSALDNKPNQPNFSAKVHRDLKCYSHQLPLMLNALVMLDDFTEENGATLLLPFSHKVEAKPTDAYFHANCMHAIGKAGDLLLFDSNIWHCSSLNKTTGRRRAIPITFTKSFMKQLFDYPRAIVDAYNIDEIDDDILQLIGFHSRVPASLDEWYLPPEQRFYKPNQD